MTMLTDAEARTLVGEVDELLGELETLDEPARAVAASAVEALVELYGEVLTRVIDHVTHAPAGELLRLLTTDEVVGHVLMAHGVIPAPPELTNMPPPATSTVPVSFIGRRPEAAGDRR